MMCARCVSTVLTLMKRSAAISLFDFPFGDELKDLALSFRQRVVAIATLSAAASGSHPAPPSPRPD